MSSRETKYKLAASLECSLPEDYLTSEFALSRIPMLGAIMVELCGAINIKITPLIDIQRGILQWVMR